jgi:hypothetical protein
VSELDLKKLGRVIAMVGSSHEGEALTALRLADRMLRDAGMRWADLLSPAHELDIATEAAVVLLGEQDHIVGISGYVVRPPHARRISRGLAPYIGEYRQDFRLGTRPGPDLLRSSTSRVASDSLLEETGFELPSSRTPRKWTVTDTIEIPVTEPEKGSGC